MKKFIKKIPTPLLVLLSLGLLGFLAYFGRNVFFSLLFFGTLFPPTFDDKLAEGYQKLVPIVRFLDEKLAANQPLPKDNEALRIEYTTATQKPYPEDVRYGQMDSISTKDYWIYTLIQWRTVLSYKTAESGELPDKGWWSAYDYDEKREQFFEVNGKLKK